LDKKIGGVMVAHLYVPALEKKGNSCYFILQYCYEFAQKKYQYKGLIITDALNMNAVAKKFPGRIRFESFQSGK
jgi:beta-glucosidase-like glycosyl hydrolase